MGGNAYTEAVQKELNLPFEQRRAGEARASRSKASTFEDVRPVLHAMTENVLLEIQKTFDFFKATAASDRIDRIVLSGGASRVDGFAEALSERFDAPVEVLRSVQAAWPSTPKKLERRLGRRCRADGGGRGRPRAPEGGRPMIRINLLAVERERDEEAARSIRAAQRSRSAAALILIATALGIGWRFWSLRQTSARSTQRSPRRESETQQLHSVLAQVQQFERARRSCSSASR